LIENSKNAEDYKGNARDKKEYSTIISKIRILCKKMAKANLWFLWITQVKKVTLPRMEK